MQDATNYWHSGGNPASDGGGVGGWVGVSYFFVMRYPVQDVQLLNLCLLFWAELLNP